MRDLLVTLFVLGSLPLAFRRPFVGLVVFSILAYMRIQDLAWGFARFQRWSFYVAAVTFAGYVAAKDKERPVMELRTQLMVLLTVLVGLGLFFASGDEPVDPAGYVEYVKIIAIALFTTAVVRTREHLRIMVWVIALSLGFYGVKNGLGGIVTLGRMHVIRGPGGMLYDNNDFGLALVMAIPMLLYLATSEKRETLRKGLMIMIPLTGVAVITTHSRGAFVSMVAMSTILVWRSRNRLMGLMIGFMLLGAALAFAPKAYYERIASIRNFREDGSAMARLRAWSIALRMIRANPVFGVGFERFRGNYLEYIPNPSIYEASGKGTKVAHNSYLQIWAECGTPAFLIYLSLIFISLADVWRIRKEARRRYHASWILSYCNMFEAVLLTFLVGSTFLNRAHFDLIYHYIAVVLVFGIVAREEMAKELRFPSGGGTARRGSLVAVAQSGFGRRRLSQPGFRNTSLAPR